MEALNGAGNAGAVSFLVLCRSDRVELAWQK